MIKRLASNFEAIVLKHSLQKDSDRLYSVITPEKGRISVTAKGVRKITSKRSGAMDTMSYVVLGLSGGNEGFYFLNEVKLVKSFAKIKKDYSLLRQAQTILELVYKTVYEHEDVNLIFNNLLSTLNLLETRKYPEMVVRNRFELKHLELLGYKVPESILNSWKKLCRDQKFLQADMIVRGYIKDVLDIELKSLEF